MRTLQHTTDIIIKNDKAFKLLYFHSNLFRKNRAFVFIKTKLKFQNCNVIVKINFREASNYQAPVQNAHLIENKINLFKRVKLTMSISQQPYSIKL